MSRGEDLLAYVQGLTQTVADLATLTKVPNVVELGSAGLAELSSPGIGVYLSPPMPTQLTLLTHGQTAYDLWQITMVISIGGTATAKAGLIAALDVASVLRNEFGQGWRYPELMPDPESPISIVENTPSSTIVQVHYVYPFTL